MLPVCSLFLSYLLLACFWLLHVVVGCLSFVAAVVAFSGGAYFKLGVFRVSNCWGEAASFYKQKRFENVRARIFGRRSWLVRGLNSHRKQRLQRKLQIKRDSNMTK